MPIDELRRAVAAYADARRAGAEPIPTAVPGLTVVRSRAPTELAPVLLQPIFCLVLQGAKQAGEGDRVVTFAAGQSLVVSHDRPTLARIVRASPAEPYLALALLLDIGIVRELAEAIDAAGGPPAAAPVAVGTTSAAELDVMARLFGLAARPEAVPVLAPLYAREAHFHLLSVAHGAMLRRLARQGSQASRITRAIAVIRRDYATALKVGDLAEAAGMSASAFHDHFRSFTGTTPLQFQKHLRLMEARRLMREQGLGVSPAAFAVGYESPTQFSREYSRTFGVAPSRDRAGEAAGVAAAE